MMILARRGEARSLASESNSQAMIGLQRGFWLTPKVDTEIGGTGFRLEGRLAQVDYRGLFIERLVMRAAPATPRPRSAYLCRQRAGAGNAPKRPGNRQA